MKIIFISSGKYPNSSAAVNRHLAYSKGLVELGHDVNFVLLKEQSWSKAVSIKDGITFHNTQYNNKKNNSKIQKIIGIFDSVVLGKEQVKKLHSEGPIDAIVILETDAFKIYHFINLGKSLKVKLFHERTEYPFIVGKNSRFKNIKLFFYLHYLIKRFDGIYVINHALKNYFCCRTDEKTRIEIINMIVDPSRFECKKNKSTNDFIVGYCGSLDGDKDGVPILLKSFALFVKKYPKSILQIIGSLDRPSTKERLLSIIEENSLESKVELIGQISRDSMPDYLCNASVLALARPNNKQAEGGFPTKLGEYLATGNAVVVTKVGEIPKFLTDGKNAFLSDPDNIESFAEKLEEAYLSEDRIHIGKEGKRLVYNDFNYLMQARKMEQFFLIKNHKIKIE